MMKWREKWNDGYECALVLHSRLWQTWQFVRLAGLALWGRASISSPPGQKIDVDNEHILRKRLVYVIEKSIVHYKSSDGLYQCTWLPLTENVTNGEEVK